MTDAGPVTWFLDVDGVLNAAADLMQAGYEYRETVVQGWPTLVWFQPNVVRRLDEIARQLRVVWVTTWREDAVYELAPALGIENALDD